MPTEGFAVSGRLRGTLSRRLGALLVWAGAPGGIWLFLLRFRGGSPAEGLLSCLGGRGPLAEKARRYFAAAPAELLPFLMAAARGHPSREVRLGAFSALLQRKEPEVLRFLAGLLGDRSWCGRGLASEGAGEAAAWPELLGL